MAGPPLSPPGLGTPGPALPRYQDTKGMASAIMALAGVYLGLQLYDFVAAGMSDAVDSAIGLLGLGLFVALAILVPLFLVRAHRNAEAISGRPIDNRPGWTAGAWFIPLAGGFLALRPLGRVWERGPGGSKVRPYAWGILWSSLQILFALLVLAAGGMTIQELEGNPQPTDAEVDAAVQRVGARLAPGFDAVNAVSMGGALAMLLTVMALQQSQQRQAAQAASGATQPWS